MRFAHFTLIQANQLIMATVLDSQQGTPVVFSLVCNVFFAV